MSSESQVKDVLGENKEDWPEVAIIVLNWNNYEDTAECLESLEDVEYPNYEVIVVDNGSTDGSGEKLKEEFGWCEFIFNEENLGFAAGNNVGVKKALSKEANHVLLLNNDIIVDDNFLSPLVKSAEKQETISAISGLIYNPHGNLWYCGGEVISHLAKAKKSDCETIKNTEYRTEYVTGAMVLIPKDTLLEVGLLNESYFFGMEDVEISYKIISMGGDIIINPKSTVVHKVSATSGIQNQFSYYNATKNRLHFAKTILPLYEKLLFYPFFLITRSFRFIQWSYKFRIDLILSVLLGIVDHIRQRDKLPEDFPGSLK
ncbi:MAG: glycosyltransferase family 2 protein [Candidatus Nanohaloarchaea archaeon]